jgi:ligand-binding sensor domain-containing protein
MMRHLPVFVLLMLVFCTPCKGQDKTDLLKVDIKSETEAVITSLGPITITRNIIQDRSGNILFATFQGVFQYDGKSFTNITSEVSSARFFSILEDRKGNLWFGSIGSGVYYYNGKSFQNFTTNDGLVNNEIVCIYEDKTGNIWFGAGGGVSRYDGKTFRNFIINGDSIIEDRTGKTFPNSPRPPNGVSSVIEDKTGKFWFGTSGNAFVYDGKAFTTLTHKGETFRNVRAIIEDKKGNIWLSGDDGLWRYDGSTFTNFTQNFVGDIYEDKKGNIWTGSKRVNGWWILSRYDEKSLSNNKPTVTEIKSEYVDNMIFGILEAHDGSIWFGTLRGAYRYDGNTITDFKGKRGQE